MYEGRTDFKPGSVFGHENLGQVVVEAGNWVTSRQPSGIPTFKPAHGQV